MARITYFKQFVQNVIALKSAIQEGIDRGIAWDFDAKKNLEELKAVGAPS